MTFSNNGPLMQNQLDFTITLREGGRVIIPSFYRKALGLQVGDELVIRLQEGELRLFQQTMALKRLRTQAKRSAKGDRTAAFLAFRKLDSEK